MAIQMTNARANLVSLLDEVTQHRKFVPYAIR